MDQSFSNMAEMDVDWNCPDYHNVCVTCLCNCWGYFCDYLCFIV